MQNESYEPVSQWSTSTRSNEPFKTQEGWYNMPATSPHELNSHVSNAQGHVFGPRARVSMSQKLSSKQGVYVGIGVVGLLIVIFLIYHGMKKYRNVGGAISPRLY